MVSMEILDNKVVVMESSAVTAEHFHSCRMHIFKVGQVVPEFG